MKLNCYKVILAGIVSIIISGCSDQGTGIDKKQTNKELLIFAGAGLRNPISELAKTFEKELGVKVMVDYAGAEVLISKAKLSKRGDLYIPGDRAHVTMAAKQGLIISQKPVCYFIPTIFVQKGNPKGIISLSDLIRPGLKIGLGNPEYIPIGRKSKKIFEKNGITWKEIEKNLKFQSSTVNELCLQIQAKSLDAVIVWDAVAKSYLKYGDEVTIPYSHNIISTVDAGILKFTKDQLLVEKFVDFICSERGKAIFRKHKYQVDLLKRK